MHPIERLRYVARAGVVPVAPLVQESAAALASFADDPNGLFMSCRRLLDRRSDCGPLVWLAARMLRAADARAEAAEVVTALARDPIRRVLRDEVDALRAGSTVLVVGETESMVDALTPRVDLRVVGCQRERDGGADALTDLAELETLGSDGARPSGDADLVLLSSDCAGASAALVNTEAVPVAEAARDRGTPVWLVVGAGRQFPESMWKALSARFDADSLARRGLAVLDLDGLVTNVVTGAGLRTCAEAASESDCPEALELFGV